MTVRFLGLCVFVGTLLVLLSSCNTSKETLFGVRSDILEVNSTGLKKDEDAESINVQIEDPVLNTEWLQSDYSPSHKIPHVEAGSLKKMLWKRRIGAGNGKINFLLSTPLVEDNLIYTLDAAGCLRAYDVHHGTEVWRHEFHKRSEQKGGAGGGVALGDGKVFVTFASGDVAALESATGSAVWNVKLPYAIRSAPTFCKDFIYLVTKNNRILCLRASTGETIWQQEGTDHSCSMMGGGKPAVQYDTVIVPYSSGELYALRRENGFPLWSESIGALKMLSSKSLVSQIKASPVIDGDMVFALSENGRMIGSEYRSGNILWDLEIRGISTPLVHGNFIFVVTADHQVVCLVRHSGKVVWVADLPKPDNTQSKKDVSYAGPILAGHKLLVVSSQGVVFMINPETGAYVDQISLPGSSNLSPIVVNKIAYFLTQDAVLVAFE